MEPAACSKRQGGDLFMKEKAGEKETAKSATLRQSMHGLI